MNASVNVIKWLKMSTNVCFLERCALIFVNRYVSYRTDNPSFVCHSLIVNFESQILRASLPRFFSYRLETAAAMFT
jgi:hypothetical protein